ncbi:MAG: L,D-transpeptidase family protein [Bacteroidia bacterium]
MRKMLLHISAVVFIFLLSSCGKNKKVVTESELVLHPDTVSTYVKNILNTETQLLCKHNLKYLDTLGSYYQDRAFETIWWKAITGDSASWADIQSDILYSKSHGLDERFYYYSVIDYYRNELKTLKNADSIYNLIAELDILISHAYVHMYNDIATGRTSPKELYGYTYMLPKKKQDKLDWESYLGKKKKKKILDKIHANDTVYNYLRDLLAVYEGELAQEQDHPIDFNEYPKIEPGDTAEVIPLIIEKLKSNLEPDSSILNVQKSNIYNEDLASAIKTLQEKYNLAADGIMGFKTYRVINSTANERINQIKANLERERWFSRPDPKDAPFIYVNLPNYRVYLYYEDSVKDMAVCIGKNLPDNYDEMVVQYSDSGWLGKLPKDMETPQISAKVSIVVINPTWTVPKSIIKNEMYWQMRRDPTYLSRNNYVVYDGDSLLDSESIDWSRFKPNTVPYRIVQVPGDFNALGHVKYIFWNAFDIFMHDTPQKSKFKLPQRAVSHGCVRLEDPLLFGEYVMQASRKYDSDDFRIMMGYEPLDEDRLEDYDPEDTTAAIQPVDTTFQIRLHKPIPIYMDYRTIFFNSEGEATFCYDIYDRNKYILRRMDEY